MSEPIIDEDELNDWIHENLETGGFSAWVNITEWDEEGLHPKEIQVTLSYKTGDGIDQPYGDIPPDDFIAEALRNGGFDVEFDGIMHYGYYCPKCEENLHYGEEDYDEQEVAICPKCGSELEEELGSKWIYGYKTIKLKGTETAEEIKKLIEKAIGEVV